MDERHEQRNRCTSGEKQVVENTVEVAVAKPGNVDVVQSVDEGGLPEVKADSQVVGTEEQSNTVGAQLDSNLTNTAQNNQRREVHTDRRRIGMEKAYKEGVDEIIKRNNTLEWKDVWWKLIEYLV